MADYHGNRPRFPSLEGLRALADVLNSAVKCDNCNVLFCPDDEGVSNDAGQWCDDCYTALLEQAEREWRPLYEAEKRAGLLDCPNCIAGKPTLLGVLGSRTHYRCRDCGTDWSV